MRFGIAALITGYLLDLLLGDPEWLYHPVRLIGKYISFEEKRLRSRGGNLRKSAVWLTVSTVLLTMACTALILWLLHLAGKIPLFIGMTLMNWMDDCMTKLLGQKFIPGTDMFVEETTMTYSLYTDQNYVTDRRPIYYGFVNVSFACFANEEFNKQINDLLS